MTTTSRTCGSTWARVALTASSQAAITMMMAMATRTIPCMPMCTETMTVKLAAMLAMVISTMATSVTRMRSTATPASQTISSRATAMAEATASL